MKRVRQLGMAAALVVAAACSSGDPADNNGPITYPPDPGTAPVLTANVSVNDNYFSPNSVSLAVGGTVTWSWIGDEGHSVTPDGSTSFSPTAPVRFPPSTLAVTFPTAGTYQYYCTVHGGDAYGQSPMVGSIFVR